MKHNAGSSTSCANYESLCPSSPEWLPVLLSLATRRAAVTVATHHLFHCFLCKQAIVAMFSQPKLGTHGPARTTVHMGTQDIIFLSQKNWGIWSPYVQNLWPLTCLFIDAFLVTCICNNSNVVFIAFLLGPFHLEKIFVISVYGQITSQFSGQPYIISYIFWFWCSLVNIFSYFYLGICAQSRPEKKR